MSDPAPLSIGYDEGSGAFDEALTAFVAAVTALDEPALLDPARCRGWSRLDTVVHVRMGLEEMLLDTASQVPEPADHDAASYWSGFAAAARAATGDGSPDDVDRVLFLRRTAAAYRRPSSAVRHLGDVAAKAPAAMDRLPQDAVVAFQGQRLAAGDFLATWAVEIACHHLDLDLPPDAIPPPSSALQLTLSTVAALAGAPVPAALTDLLGPAGGVLAALGRSPWPAEVPCPEGYPQSL